MKKIVTWITIIILVVIIGFIYFRFYFVYGQGVSAGALQSHEFNFSVDNDSVAVKLMVNSSKMVELHYKQYFGSLPWRGNSRFVVDSIISIQEARAPSGIQ
jgi:hypothetical protein